MDKNRMQKLAGLNEGYTAFNDYFEIDRYNLPEDSIKRSYLNTPIRDGNWCKYEDVAELESVAREMFGIINSIMSGLEKADRNYTPFKLTQANIRDMKSLLKKVKSL